MDQRMHGRGYLICTSTRSGSTALCLAITSTGLLGVPVEDLHRRYVEKHAPADGRFETYLRNGMLARGVRSGVVATKVFWFQLEAVGRRLAPERTPRQSFEMCSIV
jgi:LPS sulfotransferase NodH